ncbi:MAG: hypothetical protein ACM3SQ_06730 [Betaproteobacteria bacterium]
MGLRIAFDLDGVLADMEGELARHARELFGERIADRTRDAEPPIDPERAAGGAGSAAAAAGDAADDGADALPLQRLRLTPRETRQLWRHVAKIDAFWESLKEIETGVVARLASMAKEGRWEVIFLTRRPECAGATAQLQTQRWLEAKGFALPSVFVVQNSRGKIAAALALDVVVDDRPENCLDVAVDSSARAVLVWRDDAERIPAATRRLGIGVVSSVAECLDVLAHADSLARAEPGVVDRVRRLLGLKQPAGA